MMELALIGLENAINQYCRLDPNTIEQLHTLDGKVIQCDITDWDVHFYVMPYDNGIHLSKQQANTADASISGTLNSLLRVSCKKGSSEAAKQHQVKISGDIEVAQQLQIIFGNIDIDWEEHLSKLVGDSLAHQIGWRTRQVVNAGKEIAHSFKQSLSEYLHHESNSLPTQGECEQFYQQVAEIRNDVERCEARIQRLVNKQHEQDS